jgi:sugar phosphate isomerase/epimerase
VTDRELWSYTFRRSNLVELAAAASVAGFACVTTTPALFARTNREVSDLRARVAEHGVRVTFIDGLCTALPGTDLPPGEATIDDCIDMAHAVGAGAINVVHATGRPTPLDELTEAFVVACERAAAEDLRLAIEFLPHTGIPDFATAAAIVQGAGAPNGSVLLDTWHFARGGGDFAALDDAAVALIGGVQLSDRTPDQDAQPYVPRKGRRIPGEGALPLTAFTAHVRRLHPELPIGVEVLSDEIDALGLDEGARRLAASLAPLVRD